MIVGGPPGGGDQHGLPERAVSRLRDLASRQGTPDHLFTSDLSVNEFVLVREAGFDPVGLVMGSLTYHIGYQFSSFFENQEMEVLTQAMYHARELAMERMEEEAESAQAEGIVGAQVSESDHGWGSHVVEYFAVGTAITSIGPDHTIPTPTLILPLDGWSATALPNGVLIRPGEPAARSSG